MEPKTLIRTKDRMLGGVCGGIANYFEMDKSIVRIAFALLFLAGSLGLWLYLVMWLVVPSE